MASAMSFPIFIFVFRLKRNLYVIFFNCFNQSLRQILNSIHEISVGQHQLLFRYFIKMITIASWNISRASSAVQNSSSPRHALQASSPDKSAEVPQNYFGQFRLTIGKILLRRWHDVAYNCLVYKGETKFWEKVATFSKFMALVFQCNDTKKVYVLTAFPITIGKKLFFFLDSQMFLDFRRLENSLKSCFWRCHSRNNCHQLAWNRLKIVNRWPMLQHRVSDRNRSADMPPRAKRLSHPGFGGQSNSLKVITWSPDLSNSLWDGRKFYLVRSVLKWNNKLLLIVFYSELFSKLAA